jgi:hypothetical protein
MATKKRKPARAKYERRAVARPKYKRRASVRGRRTRARKKIAGIDTNTLLLVGGGAVALLLLSKVMSPSVAPAPVYRTLIPTGSSGNSTASLITAGGTAISDIISAIPSSDDDDSNS